MNCNPTLNLGYLAGYGGREMEGFQKAVNEAVTSGRPVVASGECVAGAPPLAPTPRLPGGRLLEFEAEVAAAWSAEEWRSVHVLLAVSGGADSVAMLHAMDSLKKQFGGTGRLIVAHLDHGLRGEASTADAAWLEQLCRRLALPVHIGKANVAKIASVQGDGWEAAARSARYEFLRQTAEKTGARYVATAHTADDQVETVLQRLLRGTGLEGLAGIPQRRSLCESVSVMRPMLAIRRSQVLEYLARLGQDYRNDATNADTRHVRNRLRHELLPVLREQFNGDVDMALNRLAGQAAEAQQVLDVLAANLAQRCVVIDGEPQPSKMRDGRRSAGTVRVNCRELAGQPAIIVREVFKYAWTEAGWPQQSMGCHQWQQLASLAASRDDEPPVNFPGTIRGRRVDGDLLLEFLGPP